MQIEVFYAWQSDCPARVNWELIRKAAEMACERITVDPSNDFEVSLDFSTKGVIGMCDIPQEILKKIRDCDIFLADLTLVAVTPKGKQLPNSNAVFELGYAAGRHTFRSLIGIVNEAYGKIEGQVFDIKRRASLRYTAKESATDEKIKRETEKLSKSLEEVIRDTIELWVIPRRAHRDELLRASYEAAHVEFTHQVASSRFYECSKLPAVCHSISFRWPRSVTFESIVAAVERMPVKAEFKPDAVAWSENLSVKEVCKEGVLHCVSIHDLTSVVNQTVMTGHTESAKFLIADYLQKNLVGRIAADIELLGKQGIKGPWTVGMSLAGAKDWMLLDLELVPAPRNVNTNEVNLPIVKVSSLNDLSKLNEHAGEFVPALNWFARNVGWAKSRAILPDGSWRIRTAGPIP